MPTFKVTLTAFIDADTPDEAKAAFYDVVVIDDFDPIGGATIEVDPGPFDDDEDPDSEVSP